MEETKDYIDEIDAIPVTSIDSLRAELAGIGNEGTESNPAPIEQEQEKITPNATGDETEIKPLNLNVGLKDKVIVNIRKGSQPLDVNAAGEPITLPENSVIYNGNYWAMHLKDRQTGEDSVVLDMRAKPGGYNTLEFAVSDVMKVSNTVPVATDSNNVVIMDTTTFIELNVEDPDNDDIIYTIVTQPTHGTLGVLTPGVSGVDYTPDLGYVGPDSFTFKGNDGTADSNVATANITVNTAGE